MKLAWLLLKVIGYTVFIAVTVVACAPYVLWRFIVDQQDREDLLNAMRGR